MSENVLITADLHFNDNPRDAYRWKFFTFLHDTIKRRNIGTLFILGDLTQHKEGHEAEIVNKLAGALKTLGTITQVVISTGNHDYTHNAENPFFRFVGLIPRVTWIISPQIINCAAGACLVLPHTRDYKTAWKGLRFDRYDYIFAHQTFEGATGGFGKVLEGGIPLDIFPGDAKVIAGDIHARQTLHLAKGGWITYVGSPYTINFGDTYKPRVILLNNDTSLQSIRVPGPQKRLVTLKSIDALKQAAGIFKPKAGDILKVRVRVSMSEYDNWHAYNNQIQAWAAENEVAVDSTEPEVIDQPTDSDVKFKSKANKTDKEVLSEYGRNRGIDPRFLKTGYKLIES